MVISVNVSNFDAAVEWYGKALDGNAWMLAQQLDTDSREH
jgi:hypothetical protein